MRGKIICEEAFNLPAAASTEAKLYASQQGADLLGRAMTDIQGRIVQMDEAGVEMQLLSLTSPGPQGESDPAKAAALARQANDWIAVEIAKAPTRFAALASLSMHDPAEAATELRRCMTELKGFVGNDFQSSGSDGNTMLFFDNARYDAFWKVAEELETPVYMHPRLASPLIFRELYADRPWLSASAWGFASQLSLHILGIACAGVFDRFPRLQLCMGHLGARALFSDVSSIADLFRLDHKLDRARFKSMPMAKDRLIRDYFADNMSITTSGHFSTRTLQNAIAEIGSDRVLFSVDYPYEDGLLEGSTWMDSLPISHSDMRAIGRDNAIRLFQLDKRCGLKLGLSYRELGIGGLVGDIYPHEAASLRSLK